MNAECKREPIWALGLMSGTSLDGVDAALIKTDGVRIDAWGEHFTHPYYPAERALLFACLEGRGDVAEATRMLTEKHIEATELLLAQSRLPRSEVGLLGFHGQTILHAPERGITCQIGDAALLARRTSIPVIHDFRSADVAAGGQGAPLVPLYHAALVARMSQPLVVVNIGGVANITYVDGDTIIACDTGTGNALLDDWVRQHTGQSFDDGGRIAAGGEVNIDVLSRLIEHPFFSNPPPKSLDRNSFSAFVMPLVASLSLNDGAATLAAFTAEGIAHITTHLPKRPKRWIICGGGRYNSAIMGSLNERLDNVCVADDKGFSGDALEAQAFGFLAVRSRYGLPLSLPSTTGVPTPICGGTYVTPW